jgi:hypothetical protein
MTGDNNPDSTVRIHHPSWTGEYASFKICRVCHTLCGCVWGNSERRQECACIWSQVRAGLRPALTRWPGFDFPKAAELCYCCGAEVLNSGSRWSVWFCNECKEHVRLLHQRHRRDLIPIGRHSLMNGFGLTGSAAQDQVAVKQFTLRVSGLFDRMDLLTSWASTIVAENVRTRGFEEGTDVPLMKYMDAIVRHPVDKTNAFERLCAYFQSPHAHTHERSASVNGAGS